MKLELKDMENKPFGTVEIPEDSLKALLKESLPPPAPLKDSGDEAEVAKLKEQVAELSDPVKQREKLMEIASTWTEDEYRELGEALGLSTTRALTTEEEAELKDTAEPETEAPPTAPPKPKTFLKVGNAKYEVN